MRNGLRRAAIVIGVLVVIGIAARLAAPTLVERYVNRQLADMGEYRGTVSRVELRLLAGGYVLRDLTIVETDSTNETPFVTMPAMDLTLQWRALSRGRAVGEVVMHDPVVNFIQGPSDEQQQLGAGVNWPQEIRELFPFRLNVVEARNGLVTFRAPGIDTNESLTIRDFQARLRNLTNVQGVAEPAFAEVDVRGGIMGNAPLTLTGRIDPNERTPTFDIDFSIEGAQLVDVNPWLREFLNVDAEMGAFSMYAELAAAEGKFEGYVRPILENPKFVDRDDDEKGPFRKAWEGLVNVAAKILENRQEEQVATQIPLRGEIEDPDVDLLTTIVNLLRNAFVAAFSHSLEGSINLRDVAGDVLGDDSAADASKAPQDGAQEPSRRERREERRRNREANQQ
ncbi:MAG TPA: DUF748 domain-containing protein [Gammaproteobacteria bacterium]|nr:DUF748 domain-containing protein [Gammaproteobacteria bacterium]